MESSTKQLQHATTPTRLNVLVADDDPPTRALLKAAITQWGYTVTEASDGEEAWKIIANTPEQDILILDWIMPKLDGIGLCERIKSEAINQPYIILLTQVSGTTNIVRGLEAGADEFLSKPFNMAELRSRLSVGARIIQSEKILKEQNITLSKYIQYVMQVTTPLLEAVDKINSLLEKDALKSDESSLAELKTLSQTIKKNILLLNALNSLK